MKLSNREVDSQESESICVENLPEPMLRAIEIMSKKYEAELRKDAKQIASGKGPSSRETAEKLYELIQSMDKD